VWLFIAASVLEELVKTLGKNEAQFRQFINLLIVPKLNTLDLSKCNEERFFHNLSLAAKNSPVSYRNFNHNYKFNVLTLNPEYFLTFNLQFLESHKFGDKWSSLRGGLL
jgi:hypothetical protein